MKRYLATFFRAKYLYVMALLIMVTGAAIGTYYLSRSQYESTAQIWIDMPALNNVIERQVVSYGLIKTPAQEQADKLYQLLQTDSFVIALLQNTSLASQLNGVREHEERIVGEVRQRLVVGVLGANTLKIGYSGSDPLLCQQIVDAAIVQFRHWSLQTQVEQASVELQFYQQQLKIFDEQINDLVRRSETLQRENPASLNSVSAPQYLEFMRLQRELEAARELHAATRLKIEQTSLVNSLSSTNKQGQFQVLDKPTVPQRPSFRLMKLVAYFGAGVGASLFLVLCAVIVATWQDATPRTIDDVRKLGDFPVLVVVPRLSTRTALRQEEKRPRRKFHSVRSHQGTGG